MYVGKRGQKGSYMVFRPEMYAAVRDRLTLETELRRDIERGNLALVFQPIIDIDRPSAWQASKRSCAGRTRSAGCCRRASSSRSRRATGLIVPLGRWVLREACRLGASWRMMLPAGVPFTHRGQHLRASSCRVPRSPTISLVRSSDRVYRRDR